MFAKRKLLEPVGVIYLPFTLHCVKEVVNDWEHLTKFYSITWVPKCSLNDITLWSATNVIFGMTMNMLGKEVNQEEIYCVLTPTMIRQTLTANDFKTIEHLKTIMNIKDIRMICLKNKNSISLSNELLITNNVRKIVIHFLLSMEFS